MFCFTKKNPFSKIDSINALQNKELVPTSTNTLIMSSLKHWNDLVNSNHQESIDPEQDGMYIQIRNNAMLLVDTLNTFAKEFPSCSLSEWFSCTFKFLNGISSSKRMQTEETSVDRCCFLVSSFSLSFFMFVFLCLVFATR